MFCSCPAQDFGKSSWVLPQSSAHDFSDPAGNTSLQNLSGQKVLFGSLKMESTYSFLQYTARLGML